ncbi:MAG: hypothetical protein HETSPECPRED_010612, partial [Heterodermia speciosa]
MRKILTTTAQLSYTKLKTSKQPTLDTMGHHAHILVVPVDSVKPIGSIDSIVKPA